MAGLTGRMSTVVKAKVSKLLDKAEDPAETLDYSYQKQVEQLQNVKKGIADVKKANADGKFVGSMAQNYAQPPAVAGAYHDVVTKFFHGEIKSSDAAVAELDKALNNAK